MADNKIQVLLTVDDQGTASLQKFGRTVAQAGKDGERAFSAMITSSSNLARGVASLAASYASLQGVRALISIADQYTQLEGRLRLVTASTAELAAVETQLYAVAQQTRVGYAETVELYTRLARATKDTGISQTELMATVQSVNQALIVSGATTTEANAALIQFSQGMASGVLRGEELNSVMEQTPRIAQMIADGLGISTGQLREWGKEGKLTSDVVMPALLRSAEDVNREFGLMPTTVAQAGTVLSNTLKSLVADANSGSGATAELAEAIISVSTAVDANRENILSIFANIVTAAAAAGQAILNIANSVRGFAAVAAGALSIKDFATMNPGELRGWMRDYESGLQQLKDRVNETAGALKALREEDPDLVDEDALGRAERAYNAATKELAAFSEAGKQVTASQKQVTPAVAATGKAVDVAAGAKKTLAMESGTAAKAAKDLAAEQKRLADEAERTGRAQIEAATKTREMTAELDRALFGTADAYETLGLTSRKSYEDQVKAATEAYERILSIEDLTDSERARLREGLQSRLIDLEEDYRGKAEETIGAIGIAWEDLTEDTQQVLHDWVEKGIKMEFDSVGDAFESLAEAILNVWIDLLAKMIAEWAISGIASLFSGGNLLGGISSGLGGLLGGVPIIGDLFGKSGGTLAEWGLTGAGTSALMGGGAVAAGSSLLGGGASSAAFDWGLNSFGVPALGGGAAATGAATLFGEQAAAGFVGSLDTAMAGGLEWAAIPGKEFFGTGASGAAGGAGAGLSTGAMVGGGAIMGIGALIAMGMGGHAQQEFYSPRYGNVPFRDYGHDDRQDMIRAGRSGYNWVSEAQPGSSSGGGDAAVTQTMADLERAFKQFESNTRIVLDVLAAAGDGVASLGQQLEDGTLSTAAFVDAIAGYDVSIQETATLTGMASEAARGNGTAMDSLRASLQSMGLGADQAEVAALALVAASNNQASALYAASSAASGAASAISGMTSNIRALSNTPLNIRVGVETYRTDNSNPYAIEHASGGIYSSPTLIPSIRGTRHLVGEAGAEAITPLHAGPKTLQLMHDDIKAIAARPVAVTINLDGRQIASATMPFVDAHVAAKATRGQLSHRTRY